MTHGDMPKPERLEEAKPCPFCGRIGYIEKILGMWSICCYGCGCGTGSSPSRNLVVNAWNRRPTQEELAMKTFLLQATDPQ